MGGLKDLLKETRTHLMTGVSYMIPFVVAGGILLALSVLLSGKSVVGPKFKDQLIQREIMSGTAFGRVAIPHSFEMTAFRTEGYIVIAPKGITWNAEHTHVKLVFLLAVNKDNKSTYRNVFDGLSQVAVDAENLAKLIKAHSYEEFVETLVTLENQ
ncbi:PTS sugar transporter subunit IIA [Lacticaseibacillus manihotivorans]|uniref:PTS EIIA type-2 domain-containing protein n=2 Tax=Lacticaseibacillus manihotivorans TaxID=88233 RepID=A0A0R1QSB1_9LACO|nr:PTS sugar transporter subunit IIA [Lacticaseibacillus manihotivorans]KRL47134.1 hypothetical protein FD01_GL000402 [Lacticaseibacillus manihotivorans DSM 13343 = JCM 12514]QFQ90813.1 hypothetical protein LM010_04990 [Lacticaseibacillus manihotivorans]